ncbi:hypothetical protein [Flavobacterium muglaense]|uniref:Uncharacterized protein n=1 Tax=Flavobacterium muglaense TaxID=2764716 RepID=A0A923SF35_9FLAO|nr:hypothetical protein [Flavobacterium muglaense]MBC5837538.1 hypothetical protein [Flavobacterium muglaense]MBC5844045.1 hypothetical protein [Flavobacterium muglaense]
MKNYLKKISAIFILGITIVGCDLNNPGATVPLFTNTNTSYQQLKNNLTASTGGYETTTNDFEEQSYTFKMATNGTIYSFGYSSQTAVANKNYKIELLDASATVLASAITTFLPNGSYYTLPTPVFILANTPYTLRRTFYLTDATLLNPVPSFGDPHNFMDIIGPGLRNSVPGSSLNLPITVGNMTITGTLSQQVSTAALLGGSYIQTNKFIPAIDFAFTPL